MKKKYLLSTTGSALISTLIGAALLGISGAGLFQYINTFQQTTSQTVNRVTEDYLLNNLVISNMRSLLVEKNIDQNNQQSQHSTYGLCSLIKKPEQSHGIIELKFSFSALSSNNSFQLSRWQVFFPKTEWEYISDVSKCQKIDPGFSNNHFSRCFKYIGDMSQDSGSDKATYAIAKIVPRVFPDLTVSFDYSKSHDPKKVVLNLQTIVATYGSDEVITQTVNSVQEEKITYMSYQSGVVWANDVGECHVLASDGKWAVVRLSATGVGSSLDATVFNSLLYDADIASCEGKLDISNMNDDIVQVGQNDDLRLSSVVALNARLSCNKNRFSCKQKITTEPLVAETYDSLEFSFYLFNKDISYIDLEEFNITLKRGSNELDGTSNKKLDSVDVSFSDDGASIVGNQPINHRLPKGSQLMEATIQNSNNSTQLSSHCHNICQSYDPADEDTYVYPVVNIEEKKVTINGVEEGCSFEKDYSDEHSNRVHCTVCHTKACHRYGLGTFGPLYTETSKTSPAVDIDGLSDEPLDGQIPECIAENSYSASRALPSGVEGSGSNAVNSSDCKAIAMGISDENSFKNLDSNTYTVEDCSEVLPVLCFINGQYLPAMKINTNNLNANNEVVTAQFGDAEKACLETGREVARYYDLGVFLLQSYMRTHDSGAFLNRIIETLKSLPQLNGSALTSFSLNTETDLKFNFINNAVRGIFLAPSSYKVSQLSEKAERVISSVLSVPHNKVWTAMEWDAEGLVVASPPWAPVAKDHPHALFYNKEESTGHRLVVLKDTKTYNAKNFYALAYNIRWKGLVPEGKHQRHKFVCKRSSNGEFFVTTTKGKLEDGPEKCTDAGGIFVPPESGLDWAKAMLALNPNDADYPFPDPSLYDSADIQSTSLIYRKSVNNPMAWVAFDKKIGSAQLVQEKGPRAKNLRLYKGHFPSNSLFRKERSDAVTAIRNYFNANNDPDHIIGITRDGVLDVFIENLGDLDSLNVDNISDSMKVNASDYHKVCLSSGGNEYKPSQVISVDDSCASGETVLEMDSASDSGDLKFKPTSYKYLSHWLEKVGSGDKIVLNHSGVATNAINDYNNEIDRILQCGEDCEDDYDNCNEVCENAPTAHHYDICRNSCSANHTSCKNNCN